MEFNENELIKEWKNGNSEALLKLFERYRSRLSSLSIYLCKNKEEAEDLLSETFLILLEKNRSFSGKSSFFTYVYRIMVRLSYRKRREKFYKIKLLEKLKKSSNFEEKEIEKILKLEEIVERLPAKYKEALFLKYNQGLKCEEISKILNIPAGTVKSRLSKARRILINFWNEK